MDRIVVVLLILALVKFVFFGFILCTVFKPDMKQLWRGKEKEKPQEWPTCMYCQSKWTQAVDEGQTRWEGDDLLLVTTYECQHCHLPFWHVERIPTGTLKR